MSAKLRPSKMRWWELALLVVGARPMRCTHCFYRQYSIVNPLMLFAIWVFHRVDALVNLLHPEARQSHLSRTKRRKKKRRGSSERRRTSTQAPAAPAS